MQWLMTSHVRRRHRRHGTNGHVWRVGNRPRHGGQVVAETVQVAPDPAAPSVGVVAALVGGCGGRAGLVGSELIWQPADWREIVNQPRSDAEAAAAPRRSIAGGLPHGSERWVKRMAFSSFSLLDKSPRHADWRVRNPWSDEGLCRLLQRNDSSWRSAPVRRDAI